MTTTLSSPQARTEQVPSAGALRRRTWLLWIAQHSIAIALSVMFLGPLVLLILTSFMSGQQALTSDYWPRSWHPENYAEVFSRVPMVSYMLNSLMYAGLATGFMLLSSIPAAYALSRLRWRGRNVALVLIIMMMMLPPQVTVIPLYVMWADLNLTGSLWPLILPNVLGDAFSIFLLRQFLLTIPEEYSDAARVDGCSDFKILVRVIIPMAKPAIAATAMFMFFYTWNDYFGPLLYASENPNAWPVSLGLASFRGAHEVSWNLTMAATVLVMIPVFIIFAFAQKAFVEGVNLTGVKG
ncbi:carbohydrate ABC transporter permease [Arthrobacter subterraneus]|uniref:carbohydrate ABC transporter permease n=1 Tax=Arthrobacter subterraneus TaxID=335973 RepID=UPI0037F92897